MHIHALRNQWGHNLEGTICKGHCVFGYVEDKKSVFQSTIWHMSLKQTPSWNPTHQQKEYMVFSHGGIGVTKGHWEAAQDGMCCSVTANTSVDFLTCQFASSWNKRDVQNQPQLQGPIVPNWLLVTISPRVILCKVKHQGKSITEIRACVRQQLSAASISVKPLSKCFTECKDWTCILFFHS
jgi:hypothetical protein